MNPYNMPVAIATAVGGETTSGFLPQIQEVHAVAKDEDGPIGPLMYPTAYPKLEKSIANGDPLVLSHLYEMKYIFEKVNGMGQYELYQYLLDMEEDYILYGANNFAHTVHLLHPVKYAQHMQFKNLKQQYASVRQDTAESSLKQMMMCPFCGSSMCLKTAYAFHILNNANCDACQRVINKETVAVARFCSVKHSKYAKYSPRFLETPERTITWFSVLQGLKNDINAYVLAQPTYRGTRKTAAKEGNAYFKNIIAQIRSTPTLNNLSMTCNMDLVKGMYRQLDFIFKICNHFEYWNDQKVIATACDRYQKFFSLMKKDHILVPTLDIDLAWHAHQTQHSSYCTFSKQQAGFLVDHDDTISSNNLLQAYAYTFIRWSKKLKERYSYFPPDKKSWSQGKNFLQLSFFSDWSHHSEVAKLTPANDAIKHRGIIGTPVMTYVSYEATGASSIYRSALGAVEFAELTPIQRASVLKEKVATGDHSKAAHNYMFYNFTFVNYDYRNNSRNSYDSSQNNQNNQNYDPTHGGGCSSTAGGCAGGGTSGGCAGGGTSGGCAGGGGCSSGGCGSSGGGCGGGGGGGCGGGGGDGGGGGGGCGGGGGG